MDQKKEKRKPKNKTDTKPTTKEVNQLTLVKPLCPTEFQENLQNLAIHLQSTPNVSKLSKTFYFCLKFGNLDIKKCVK